MAILLTGCNGFLWITLYDHFSSTNEVHNIHRAASDNLKESFTVADLATNSPERPKVEFELVIHAAGMAHFVPKTEEEKHFFS